MHDFNAYCKLILDMIALNYQILKVQTPDDLICKREFALRLYLRFEKITRPLRYDEDQLTQIELLMMQLNETNKYVIELLERKMVVMKIQQSIRRDRIDNVMDSK